MEGFLFNAKIAKTREAIDFVWISMLRKRNTRRYLFWRNCPEASSDASRVFAIFALKALDA